jgi:Glycosyltransferase like family 2
MKGVVVVPAWRRPDFLWACLERLRRADGWDDHIIVLSLDREPDPDVVRIAKEFQAGRAAVRVDVIERAPHPHPGNSYNVLAAYARATELAAPEHLIHLIEEDVLVARGYFRYAEAAHRRVRDCYCVSACRDQNASLPHVLAKEPDQARPWIYERDTYQSLAVSFRPSVVKRVLATIHGVDYFGHPVETLASRFPATKIPRSNAEQDGLFGRMLEEWVGGLGWRGAIYPAVPRACHVGWVGYNRSGGRPLYDGTPEERGQTILDMTEAEMNARADGRFRDIARCDLDAEDPPDLALSLVIA